MKSKAIIIIAVIALLFIGTIVAVAVPWGQKNNGEYVYRAFSDHAEILEYIGDGYDVAVPDEIDGVPVTLIGAKAFYDNTKIERITLGANVRSAGKNAFRGCTKLTEAIMNDCVEELGSGCFAGCTSLTSFTVPSSVTSLGSDMFYGCTNLITVLMPSQPKFQTVGSSTFRGCTSLISCVIPEGVTSLGTNAFQDCRALKEVTMPKTLTYIANKAIFKNCAALEEIQVKEGSKADTWCKNNGFAEKLKYSE